MRLRKMFINMLLKLLRHTRKSIEISPKNVALPFTETETVHNLSDVTLTTEELELLKYGLKHPLQPLQVNETDILTTFDFIHRAMTKDLRDKKQSAEVKKKIYNLAQSYVNSYKPILHALKKHQILKRLGNNKFIVFYVQILHKEII